MEWTGRLLLNVSPSSPVNALASTEFRVKEAEHDLDYPIDMPTGVNTALVVQFDVLMRSGIYAACNPPFTG